MKKYTTILFIEKANQKHNNYYGYCKSIYINSKTSLIITCPIHGDFIQNPTDHLNGCGCKKCAYKKMGRKRLNTNLFIEKAISVHGNRYGYLKLEYIDSNTYVKITCFEHGDFLMKPNNHLNKQGCKKCGGKLVFNTEEFINESIKKHGETFTYLKSIYVSTIDELIITCQYHGDFLQKPREHLAGYGCQKCGNMLPLTTEEFINKANIVHNFLYTYLKTIYVRANDRVIITCSKHGDFKQIARDHTNGCGCPKCSHIFSKIENKWLDSLGIKEENRQISLPRLPKLNKVDGYDPETNTVYQFHGDYWHCNPNNPLYSDSNKLHNLIKFRSGPNKGEYMTYGEVYQKTLNKEILIKEAGYNLIIMWESDFI